MRFHLPAYLIADLAGTLNNGIIFHLTYSEGLWRFEELSASQCEAVVEFLLLRLSDPDCDFDRPLIEKALAEYWMPRQK